MYKSNFGMSVVTYIYDGEKRMSWSNIFNVLLILSSVNLLTLKFVTCQEKEEEQKLKITTLNIWKGVNHNSEKYRKW